MNKFFRRKWAIGLVVLAVALAATGVAVPALADTNRPPANVSTGVYLDQATLARIASVLGLTQAALTEQLKAGKTLAQIAAEKNVQTTALVEAIIAPHADEVGLRVKYGYPTEAEAQALLQTLRDQATLFLQQNLSAPAGYSGGLSGHCGFGAATLEGSANGWGGIMGGW